ncbi:Uncharacterised protein [Mycoplasmopsis arginini]|nr:Uncharacterised protein [Chlamydia trachomatis]SGA02799.1 Uncharacterised protein [Chlamydia abortus]SGA04192.1 Uncharacterised protein [Mycoplasmopsis arginini]CRH54586.1 Uncharacterised protein [Chlamydia trachomatis]SGA21868.1 Uncharacterised protein [Mycoplasmopsis arginini]
MNIRTPKVIIDHLRTFFIPRSFEILNKSKSLLPTKAPLKLLESGAIINDIPIIPNEIIDNITTKIHTNVLLI